MIRKSWPLNAAAFPRSQELLGIYRRLMALSRCSFALTSWSRRHHILHNMSWWHHSLHTIWFRWLFSQKCQMQTNSINMLERLLLVDVAAHPPPPQASACLPACLHPNGQAISLHFISFHQQHLLGFFFFIHKIRLFCFFLSPRKRFLCLNAVDNCF